MQWADYLIFYNGVSNGVSVKRMLFDISLIAITTLIFYRVYNKKQKPITVGTQTERQIDHWSAVQNIDLELVSIEALRGSGDEMIIEEMP